MFDRLDTDAYENVLIYPATRKIATADPYYSAYEYYQRCCERASVCLAIGYSFRDYDALTRLRGAASANEGLKVALIAPSAKATLTNVNMEPDRKKPFDFCFGDNQSLASSDIGSFLLECMLTHVNRGTNPTV